MPPTPPGDLDGEFNLDINDYGFVLDAYGCCQDSRAYRVDADYDHDGCITLADYQIWLGHYRAYQAKHVPPLRNLRRVPLTCR